MSILRISLSVVCLPPGAPPPPVSPFSSLLLVLDPQLVVFSFSRDREV